MSRWKTVSVEVDVDISDFDDEDIRDEFVERFGPDCEIDHGIDWRKLYEIRALKSEKDFLEVMDKIIMNQTGRIL